MTCIGVAMDDGHDIVVVGVAVQYMTTSQRVHTFVGPN